MGAKVCQGRITSPFGMRHDPINRSWVEHNGVDISAVVGSAVLSPCNGTVAAIYSNAVGGKTMVINSSESDHRFAFCHLSTFVAASGQTISKGQLVARTGNTGRTTGPHLHFSVMSHGQWVDNQYLGGKYIDPVPFLDL